MARRYSGPVTIEVLYRDGPEHDWYECTVRVGGRGTELVVRPPACGYGTGIAYDSPEAYDRTAQAALALAGCTPLHKEEGCRACDVAYEARDQAEYADCTTAKCGPVGHSHSCGYVVRRSRTAAPLAGEV